MGPRHAKVGSLLKFTHLDRGSHLDFALVIGFRFKDDGSDPWTALVNRVKIRDRQAVGAACAALIAAMATVRVPNGTLIIPILGSQDTTVDASHPVTRLATAMGRVQGCTACLDALSKPRHRSLHSIYNAIDRDREVQGKYSATLPDTRNCPMILLVDDMITRGSTMNDAARAIRKAGFKGRVGGLALAKSESRAFWGGAINNDHISATIQAAAGIV